MSFEDISVEEFKERMTEENTVILDVRTPQELNEGEIPGHIMIDFRSPDFRQRINELERGKTYLVYCRSGARSANTCELMGHLGFTKLFNLSGGIMAWNSAEKA